MDEPLHEHVKDSTIMLMTAAATHIVDHMDQEYPNEAVGIVCASGEVYPLINQARSPKRFEVSQTLVGEALLHLKHRGKVPVAVYHSHPEGMASPSSRDEMMMQDMPGALFIISGKNGIAGWLWDDGLRFVARIDLPVKVSNVEHS